MPQPLKPGFNLNYRPKILMERPQHAAGIGLVAAEWAALENHLIEMFRFSLFAFSKDGHAAGHIAKLTLDALESLSARLDVIESIIKDKIPADLYQHFVDKITPEIRRRGAERHRVVHGHWHISDKHPDELILMEPGEEPMRYTVKDFDDIASRIIDTSNVIGSFWHHVGEQVNPHPWRLESPQPDPKTPHE